MVYRFSKWHLFNFQENSTFEHLRVMVIDDMVYLIHVIELATFVNISLNLETEMLYADLETDPPKVLFICNIISYI